MSITLDMWLAKVWAYTDSLRAQGYKVAMGTILPQYNINGSAYMTEFTRRRPLANAAIRAAVGAHIDAVIDFAADPTIGPDSAAANRLSILMDCTQCFRPGYDVDHLWTRRRQAACRADQRDCVAAGSHSGRSWEASSADREFPRFASLRRVFRRHFRIGHVQRNLLIK
jgi:hypothetical protein